MQAIRNAIASGLAALSLSLLTSMLDAAPAVAQESPRYYGPHMMWDGGWWMLFGPLWMILFLAAIVASVVLLIRWLAPTGQTGPGSSAAKTPLDILRERFARGEIDKEEFEERRRILGD